MNFFRIRPHIKRWNGLIEVSDQAARPNIKTLTAKELQEGTVNVEFIVPEAITISDTTTKPDIKTLTTKPLTEGETSIVFEYPVMNIVDNTGEFNLVSADGQYNITIREEEET